MRPLIALLSSSILLASTAFAGECTVQSPAYKVPIVELYTSEGCSSCPPADDWLSVIGAKQPQAIALSMHVNYWDYIGWPDRFAKKAFTDRQRWLANLNANRTVYTPGIFVNAHEYRDWDSDPLLGKTVKQMQTVQPGANIQIDQMGTGSKASWKIVANTLAAKNNVDLKLFIASTTDQLVSKVSAGENKGSSLKHDSVVGYWSGPINADSNGRFETALNNSAILSGPNGSAAVGMIDHLVAFVQDTKTGEVLQAARIKVKACQG
jgi:hypothetical protein